jgi:hypothetical protein
MPLISSAGFAQEVLAMARKTGVPTLLEIALRMCQFITTWYVVIVRFVDFDEDVIAALGLAQNACYALRDSLEPYRPLGD